MSRFRFRPVRPLALLGLAAAALLFSACSTEDWGRLVYNTGKNMCERSAHQCNGGRSADGHSPPMPNLPPGAPRY